MSEAGQATVRDTRPATGPLVAWSVLAVLQATIGLVSYFALDDSRTNDPLFTWSFALGALVQFAVVIGLTVAIASAHPAGAREALGLNEFARRWVFVGIGVIFVSLVLSAIMEAFTNAAEEQGLTPERWHPDRAGAFAASAAMVVLLGPLAEELFFRGLGARVLSVAGPAVAIVGSALAFALAHGVPGTFPPLFFFGAGLAWVRLRSDSVWPGYIAHATYNGLALALAAASF